MTGVVAERLRARHRDAELVLDAAYAAYDNARDEGPFPYEGPLWDAVLEAHLTVVRCYADLLRELDSDGTDLNELHERALEADEHMPDIGCPCETCLRYYFD